MSTQLVTIRKLQNTTKPAIMRKLRIMLMSRMDIMNMQPIMLRKLQKLMPNITVRSSSI